jgi:hypothetical protein
VRFEIRLQRPSQLFVADDVLPTSPFYNEYTVRPAMGCIRERIWESRRVDGVEVTLLLPASEIRPGLGEELTVAARRWAEVVDKTCRIDSRMISAVGRRMTVMVFVLYVVTMAAGLVVIRLSRGTHGPWVETVGQTLVIGANVLIWYPLELVVVEAMERRTRNRRTAWLHDPSIHVQSDEEARPDPELAVGAMTAARGERGFVPAAGRGDLHDGSRPAVGAVCGRARRDDHLRRGRGHRGRFHR